MDIDVIKCPTCIKILNLPVFLPCGHTICKQHVDKAVENNETSIKCKICDKLIGIPSDGFVGNRFAESVLDEMKKEKASFGEKFKNEYNQARETCESFGELLGEFNRVKNDPEMKIHTVINELRNRVDLRREELKQEIDRRALTLIQRLDEFEKECKANAPNVKSDCKLDETLLERLKNDLDETRKSSVTFELVEKWMKIVDESKSAIKEIQSELLKFNESLFLNLLNSFYLEENLALKTRFSIRFTVKGLSKYKDSKESSKLIASYKEKAYGFEWELFTTIEQIVSEKNINENDNYIGVFLRANQSQRIIQSVKVDYDLEILDQFGMGKSRIGNHSYLFNSSVGWGRPGFITFKDLMKNYNLYNIEDDSCIVQAQIKQIEWV